MKALFTAAVAGLAGVTAMMPAGASTTSIGNSAARDCWQAAEARDYDRNAIYHCNVALDQEGLDAPDRAATLVNRGVLFGLIDSGIAICWKSDTGEELWKERLGGTFTASLVLVGENLYAVNEAGQCFIFKASPEKFELVAKNDLGSGILASPAVADGRLYLRTQDELVCVGAVKN